MFSNAKVGDPVVVFPRWNDPIPTTISRLTAMLVIVRREKLAVPDQYYEQRFRRDTGVEYGEHFDHAVLKPLTPGTQRIIDGKALTLKLGRVNWHCISLETKQAIDKLLDDEAAWKDGAK